ALDGSTPADADLTVDTDYPTTSYSGYVDFVPTRNFYLSGSAGYYEVDSETTGVDAISQIRFRNGVIPVPTTDPRYRPALFQTVPSASFQSITEDNWTREAAALASNLHVKALGDHSFKAGVQYELIKNTVSRGENGNDFEIRWGLADRYGIGVIGTYGSVAVRHFRTEGGAESKNIGLFLQDSWAIRPNLTLNLGVRTEQERVPNYGAARDSSLPTNAIEFDFEDKLAPRLGFAWDVLSSQKLKVYGSYGIYYDITKIEMPRGSFGADQWITHVYPLNTLDWETLDDGCAIAQNNHTQNPCPALGAQRTRDLRLPTDPATAIDPDLQPMEQEEWQIGTEFQVSPNSVLGFRYVNKTLITTIEDIGYLVFHDDGSSAEEYITGNPGRGLVAGDPPGPSPAQAEAVRDYQAATLSFSRRFVDNWSLRANYTWSRLEGNYSGLASSDEFGRTDPNVARYFDGLAYGYDQNGRLVSGPLNTDHPHRVGAQFLYRMPWGTHVGLNSSWKAGSPISSEADFNGVGFFPYGRGNQGDLDDVTQTDILVAHPFQIGPVSLELSVNVLNLFDEDTVTRVGNTRWQDDICDIRADCDGTNDWYFGTLVPYDYDTIMAAGHATPDPSFNQALSYQAPRVVRLGLKLAF
ncbi:MAG: hypothetical protein M3550_08485, partial [Actinomycetota bacterium]|nr:hypothetical protein [Actinomycetota bacterium]